MLTDGPQSQIKAALQKPSSTQISQQLTLHVPVELRPQVRSRVTVLQMRSKISLRSAKIRSKIS